MDKYQAYPEYKDASGNWMGKVPSHWTITSLKRVCDLSTGLTPPTSNEANYVDYDSGFSWVRPEDLNEGQAPTTASKFLSKNGWELMRVVPKSSTLICCIGTIGKAGYVQKDVSTNQQITSASFHYSPKYNYYLVKAAREVMEETATGNVIQILNSERLGGIPFLLLPKSEADKIANFLDHETAKIDTLIDKQQQLIKLLKEKRQAVISHAVTKGLNPNAPMRESGVEWLGEVPEHWKIWKFRHIAPIITCGIASTPTYVDGSEGVAFLSAQNIRENKLSLHKYNYITHDLHEQLTKYRKPEVGDLLVTRVGAGIGEACVVNIDMEFSIYVSLTHIRVDPAVALNTFVMYFFGSDYCKYLNYQGTVTGGGVGNLNVQNVERYKLPLPNLEEQQKIVNYLDFEGERFSALIKKSELAIKLMQERRTALISAAVTGKIDVRHPVCHPTGDLQSSKSTVHGDL